METEPTAIAVAIWQQLGLDVRGQRCAYDSAPLDRSALTDLRARISCAVLVWRERIFSMLVAFGAVAFVQELAYGNLLGYRLYSDTDATGPCWRPPTAHGNGEYQSIEGEQAHDTAR